MPGTVCRMVDACGTALISAAENGHVTTVQLLLEKGVDVDIPSNVNDRTPLSWWAARKGSEDVVKLLLEHGVGVNVNDYYGKTPRCCAAESGHYLVAWLLTYDADETVDQGHRKMLS